MTELFLYKRLHSGAIAACFVAIIVSLVGCGEREPRTDIPPEPSAFTVVARDRVEGVGRVTVFDVAGLRCVARPGEFGDMACLLVPRPPIYGDVESAAQVARCDTDTDCMQKFGGDGSPHRVKF